MSDVEDELDKHFAVRALMRKHVSAVSSQYSVRWWPKRYTPTAAFVKTMTNAWFVVCHKRVEPVQQSEIMARAIEVMSPIPHDATDALVDAFEFFELGAVLRTPPSSLATDLAQVWHGPKKDNGCVVFFYVRVRNDKDARIHRMSIDIDNARIDDAPLQVS